VRRPLFVLVACVVITDTMFFSAITPLLPDYASDLNLSKTGAGILSAAYAGGTLLGTFPGAMLAARVGMRQTVLAGMLLVAGSCLVFAFAQNIVLLDAARFVQGVGGSFAWIGGLSWLVSETSADRRGEVIGSALAAAIFGVLMGPVLGAIASVTGPEPVFASAAVFGTAMAVWTYFTPAPGPAPFPGWRRVRRTIASAPIAAGFWLVMLPAMLSGAIWVLAPLRLDELGASGIAVGAVFLISALVEGAASPTFGRISDRRGRIWPIRIGLFATAAMSLALPLPETILLLGACVVASELALGFCWTPAMALLSDNVERAGVAQWLAFALVNLAWAGGQVLGGSGGGGLADATSDGVTYAVVASLLALTALAVAARGSEAAAPSAAVAE
jgi:MFS family permease